MYSKDNKIRQESTLFFVFLTFFASLIYDNALCDKKYLSFAQSDFVELK